MKKRRIISSVSGVITNSSTQVFEIGITEELLELLKKENIEAEVTIIKTRQDLFDLFPDTTKMSEKEIWSLENKQYDIFALIYESIGCFNLCDEDCKGFLWKELNEAGKTDKEILEFFDCILDIDHNIVGKVIYSYEDDCGYPKAAEVLDNYTDGLNSRRLS